MHPELQRYLDGEFSREELPPEVAGDAAEWDALLGAASRLGGERAPPWLEDRVMRALPEREVAPARPIWRRAWRWLVRPQQIRVRPAVGLATAAAAALLLFFWPGAEPNALRVGADRVAARATGSGSAEQQVYVQFALAAGEDARSVALAGDFNGWQPGESPLRDPDGDGVWTGLFALPTGVHKYMFVVNGERWVTDPRAERYVHDGFGMRNALIAVRAPSGSPPS